uniref:Uncharacterized protein n=1 Tax=Rhizophora mucronata TaxID=61149 RepID=A0A2P2KR95_RHIMU
MWVSVILDSIAEMLDGCFFVMLGNPTMGS